MKIVSVIQLKDIEIGEYYFPLSKKTRIVLDKKNPLNKKEHRLLYQQYPYYGEVGDMCKYISNIELLELEKNGFVSIERK